jgi:hypothetical protein
MEEDKKIEAEEASRLGNANAQIMPPLRNYMSGYSFPTEKLKQTMTGKPKDPLIIVQMIRKFLWCLLLADPFLQ